MQLFKSTLGFPSSLEIGDYFANVVDEYPEYYVVEVTFSILQSMIVRKNLDKIIIKASNPNATSPINSNEKVFEVIAENQTDQAKKSNNYRYGRSEIQSILTKSQTQRNQAASKNKTIVSIKELNNLILYVKPQARFDLATSVPGDDSSFENVVASQPLEQIQSLYSMKDVLVPKNNIFPSFFSKIQQKQLDENINNQDATRINRLLLNKEKIDPSQGILLENTQSNRVKALRKFYLEDSLSSFVNTNYYSVEKQLTFSDRISITAKMNIPKNFSSVYLDLEFEVYKKGLSIFIDKKKTKLEIAKLLSAYKRVEDVPTIGGNSRTGTISIKQSDISNSVDIYRKSYMSNGQFSSEELVDKVNIQKNKSGFYKCNYPSNRLDIYRFFSYNSETSVRSSKYTSIVVGEVVVDSSTLVIIDDPTNNNAVKIRLLNPHPEAIQYSILRKFSNRYIVVKNFTNITTVNEAYDTGLIEGKIYTYAVKYKLNSGTVVDSISQDHLFINSSENSDISTSIIRTNYTPAIDQEDGPSFTMNISCRIKEDKTKELIDQLSSNALYQQYAAEFVKINDTVNSLIRINVVRINHRTGIRETFSGLTADSANLASGQVLFEDNPSARKKFGILPLEVLTNYTYEIRVSVSNPVVLLRDYVKSSTVTIGNSTRLYYYRPYKWLQNSVKRTGTLPASDSEGNPLVDEDAESLQVGVAARYDTAGQSKRLAEVVDLSVERIEVDTARISWSLQGEKSDYDHFVVVKDVNGDKKILGTYHNESFVDTLSFEDAGTVFYYVTPILADFTVGTTAISNSLLIEPGDFRTIEEQNVA